MEVPTWVDIVKTASYKELAPYDPDWFYIRAGESCFLGSFSHRSAFHAVTQSGGRCIDKGFAALTASMARKVYVNGNMGVGAFRKSYGGAMNNGTCRHHHQIGSGSVARAILKQLESVGVVEISPKGGRRITPSGQVSGLPYFPNIPKLMRTFCLVVYEYFSHTVPFSTRSMSVLLHANASLTDCCAA